MNYSGSRIKEKAMIKRELIPYYLTRIILAALLGLWVGLSGASWWMGVLTGALVWAGFLWYAHSGHYLIDPSRPLAPLRRNERGLKIRDRALVSAVSIGGLSFALLSMIGQVYQFSSN